MKLAVGENLSGLKKLQQNPQFTMPVRKIRKPYQLGRRLGKQGPRTPDQASAGCEKYVRSATTFNIIQANMSGLQNKTTELNKLLHDQDIHIALLQETLLPDR